MLRRDYFMRMVQEMAQVLARVISLRRREEYDQAMSEIDRALREIHENSSEGQKTLSLEDWIALCRKHEQAAAGMMMGVANLLSERGEIESLQGNSNGAHRSRTIALGLLLEALLSGDTFVSAELLDKVEQLADAVQESLTDDGVWHRLVGYFEARGRYSQAEDALFRWRETNAAGATREGIAFYERLLVKDDADLERGNLPRSEVEEGQQEFTAPTA